MDFSERTAGCVAVLLGPARGAIGPAPAAAVAAFGLTCRRGDPAAGMQVIAR